MEDFIALMEDFMMEDFIFDHRHGLHSAASPSGDAEAIADIRYRRRSVLDDRARRREQPAQARPDPRVTRKDNCCLRPNLDGTLPSSAGKVWR